MFTGDVSKIKNAQGALDDPEAKLSFQCPHMQAFRKDNQDHTNLWAMKLRVFEGTDETSLRLLCCEACANTAAEGYLMNPSHTEVLWRVPYLMLIAGNQMN